MHIISLAHFPCMGSWALVDCFSAAMHCRQRTAERRNRHRAREGQITATPKKRGFKVDGDPAVSDIARIRATDLTFFVFQKKKKGRQTVGRQVFLRIQLRAAGTAALSHGSAMGAYVLTHHTETGCTATLLPPL